MADTKNALWGKYRDFWFRENKENIPSDEAITIVARLALEAVAYVLGSEFAEKGPGTDQALRDAIALEDGYRVAQQSRYTVPTYAGDNLTQIDVYDDNLQSTLLFTKTLGYTGDNLTQVVITDVVNGGTLTTALGYTGDDLTSIEKTVT